MLLGIPASSVTSERAFSAARLIDTRLRAQLGDELFSDLLFIAKNLPDNGRIDGFIALLLDLAEEHGQMGQLAEAVVVVPIASDRAQAT